MDQFEPLTALLLVWTRRPARRGRLAARPFANARRRHLREVSGARQVQV
jgi:hypothetical protein